MSPASPTETATDPSNSSSKPAWLASTASYYAAFVGLGLIASILGPTLPGLAEHTRTDLGAISFLFTARAFGYLLGSLQGGRLYDRVPGHRLMAGVLILIAAMSALVPLVPVLWLLTAVLLLVGIGEGTLDVGGNTLLIWVHGKHVGPFMNGLHFFFGVGAFLAPVFVAQAILLSGDIHWAYWALSLLMIPMAAWILRLPSPQQRDSGTQEASQPANAVLVFLIALFFFLYVGAEVGFGGWIFSYTTVSGLGDEATAAYLTSAFWGALTVGRFLAIPIATRLRPRLVLLADLLGCLAGVGLILLLRNSLLAVWVGTLVAGLSMASIFPTTLAFAERRMAMSGKTTSWFFVGSGAGGMLLPWLIGQLFERFGPQATMFSILTDVLVALLVFSGLMLFSAPRRVSELRGQEG